MFLIQFQLNSMSSSHTLGTKLTTKILKDLHAPCRSVSRSQIQSVITDSKPLHTRTPSKQIHLVLQLLPSLYIITLYICMTLHIYIFKVIHKQNAKGAIQRTQRPDCTPYAINHAVSAPSPGSAVTSFHNMCSNITP